MDSFRLLDSGCQQNRTKSSVDAQLLHTVRLPNWSYRPQIPVRSTRQRHLEYGGEIDVHWWCPRAWRVAATPRLAKCRGTFDSLGLKASVERRGEAPHAMGGPLAGSSTNISGDLATWPRAGRIVGATIIHAPSQHTVRRGKNSSKRARPLKSRMTSPLSSRKRSAARPTIRSERRNWARGALHAYSQITGRLSRKWDARCLWWRQVTQRLARSWRKIQVWARRIA